VKQGMFKSVNTADELLSHVVNANWKEVEKIAAQNPDLMFSDATATNINGYGIMSTPLEYAFHVLDMFTLKIFQKHVRIDDASKFYEMKDLILKSENMTTQNSFEATKAEFNAVAERWLQHDPDVTIEKMREFLRVQTHQFVASQPFFNLQPFYWTYEFLLTLHSRSNVTDEAINEFWNKIVGWAQWHLLPRHMLKQLFAGATYMVWVKLNESSWTPENETFKNILQWSPDADFSHLDYHFPIDIIDLNNKFNWEDGSACNLVIGNGFALGRGAENNGIQNMVHVWNEFFPVSSDRAKEDLIIFRHLADVRHQQVCQLQPGFIKRFLSMVVSE
jgi:hypothetical protein